MICEPHERPRSHRSARRAYVATSALDSNQEYVRIQKRATEAPGTARGQGQGNWATLFREWLPRYFHVVNKGSILTDSGYASP